MVRKLKEKLEELENKWGAIGSQPVVNWFEDVGDLTIETLIWACKEYYKPYSELKNATKEYFDAIECGDNIKAKEASERITIIFQQLFEGIKERIGQCNT